METPSSKQSINTDPTTTRSSGKSEQSSTEQQPPHSGITICSKTELQGHISFGENCIVHPACSIIAEGGDIIIGENNIFEERVRIINRIRKDENGKPFKKDMYIGNFNVFEVGAQIDSCDIGDLNEFQHKSTVLEGCKIENYCQINPCVVVQKNTNLESYSVVYEEGKVRTNMEPNEEAKKVSIKELCAFLSAQLPKYNSLRKV